VVAYGTLVTNYFWEPFADVPSLFAEAFQNELQYGNVNARVDSGNDATTPCKNLVNISPVTWSLGG